MSGMFCAASAFNQNISSWNTAAVTTMSYMFKEASAFDQDLSNWCVSYFNSEPGNFRNGANSAWATATPKQPNWGADCS